MLTGMRARLQSYPWISVASSSPGRGARCRALVSRARSAPRALGGITAARSASWTPSRSTTPATSCAPRSTCPRTSR
eukprot:3845366-Alexandrium_andersonii.AAC.1